MVGRRIKIVNQPPAVIYEHQGKSVIQRCKQFLQKFLIVRIVLTEQNLL